VNRPDLRWDTESRAGEKLAEAEEVRGLEGRVDSRVVWWTVVTRARAGPHLSTLAQWASFALKLVY
jgi:hypothetical protein